MKILITEDDAVARYLIATTLKEWGHEVRLTENGGEAWHHLYHEEDIDIAILDINLPGMSGLDICDLIRKNNLNCYVIIMTARHDAETLEQVLAMGANDYIQKGAHAEEIQLRLQAAEEIVLLKKQMARSMNPFRRMLSSFKG